MAYDLEQHGLAQRYLIQALRLARGADDHALGGEILAGMAHQADLHGPALPRARPGQGRPARRPPGRRPHPAGLQPRPGGARPRGARRRPLLRRLAARGRTRLRRPRPRRRAALAEATSTRPTWRRSSRTASATSARASAPCGRPGARLDMDGRYRARAGCSTCRCWRRGCCSAASWRRPARWRSAAWTLAGELQSARSRSYVADLRRRLEPYKKRACGGGAARADAGAGLSRREARHRRGDGLRCCRYLSSSPFGPTTGFVSA